MEELQKIIFDENAKLADKEAANIKFEKARHRDWPIFEFSGLCAH